MRSHYLKQIHRPGIVIGAAVMLSLIINSPSPGMAEQEEPIQPVWQLLNGEQKQQFIAGYLHGMRDAASLTSVLEQFLKQNPTASQESVQRLQSLYRSIGSGDSHLISSKVDRFLTNPKNADAPLSRAVTAE